MSTRRDAAVPGQLRTLPPGLARPGVDDRRIARGLLGVYLVFLLYGSLFPFHLTIDGPTIWSNLRGATIAPFDAAGRRTFSLTDFASNGILGAPLGLLLVMGALAGASLRTRLGRVGVSSLGVAAAVEALQLFTPERTASAMDVGGQMAGALAGAVAGHVLISAAGRHLTARGLIVLRRHPALGPAAALMVVLAADALFPYTPTLDLGAVWNSFKHAAWLPLQASRLPPWHALVVSAVLPGAVLAALLLALFRRSSTTARLGAWGLASGYVVGLQLAKLFIEGRSPNANHAFAVSAGALLGVLAGPAVTRLSLARTHAALACTVGAALLLVYDELEPFDWRVTMEMAKTKAASIEWLPFASYYAAEPERALFDVGKKLLLGGLLGAALRAGHLSHPWLWSLGFATLLEALQLLQPSRQPALTDVLSLTAGAAMGAAILVRYRALIAGAESAGGWPEPDGTPPDSSRRAGAGDVLG